MGISIALLTFFAVVALVFVNQKLGQRKKAYQDSFVSLKIALGCRHQAVRHVLEASRLYWQQSDKARELGDACMEAERILGYAVRSFSRDSIARLCQAESRLNILLRDLQTELSRSQDAHRDSHLKGQLELLDEAENDVVSLRRAYNRAAERYNHFMRKPPVRLCAPALGYVPMVGLVRFEDNNVPQISSQLLA